MNIHKIKGSYNRRTTSYLRYHATNEWKEECFRKANNQCEITGKRGKSTLRLTVHHCNESFFSISKRVHRELGVKYHECIDDYKPEDLQAVVDGIKEAHKTCIGVVMTEICTLCYIKNSIIQPMMIINNSRRTIEENYINVKTVHEEK